MWGCLIEGGQCAHCPVFDQQSVNTLKLPNIVGDNGKVASLRLSCNQRIEGTNRHSESCQLCADFTRVLRHISVELDQRKILREKAKSFEVCLDPLASICTVVQFMKNDM